MKNLKNSFDSLEKLILDLRIEKLNKSLQKLNLETEELEEDFQNLKTN